MALLVVVVGLFVAGGVVLSAMSVRRDMVAAQARLREGQTALSRGDSGAAESAFGAARNRFSTALGSATNGWFDVVGQIPILGRTRDAAAAIAESGMDVAEAGVTLSNAVRAIPGGLDALSPAGGRVPVELFAPLAEAASAARDQVGRALDLVESAPDRFLLGPVATARSEAQKEIRSLHETMSTGSDLLEGLPAFLGADGPRRYFFGAQNPAELRGTGGVMGAYSILTVDDGRFEFTDFGPVQSLPIPGVDEVPPPDPEYAENYDQFRAGRRFWLALNLTPDFPTAAQEILNAYEVTEGVRLDGVILADPFALEALMRITGPVSIPRLHTSIGADDVVDFTTNGAYRVYTNPAIRKRVLGAVAQAVFGAFLARSDNDFSDLRVLTEAASAGHVLAYSDDPAVETGLSRTGSGGVFSPGDGDFFSLVENSAGGTKVDFFQNRTISYDVQLWPDGSAEASASVEFTNHAPTTGQPAYVIGPDPGYAALGEDAQLVSWYCRACQLEEARRDGRRIAVGKGTEQGLTYYRDYFRTPSGSTRRVEMTWYIPHAWEGDANAGTYLLNFLEQNTIRPSSVSVRITPPDGMHIGGTTSNLRVDGDAAVYEGTPSRHLALEVDFQAPLWARLWRAMTP